MRTRSMAAIIALGAACTAAAMQIVEYKSGIVWPEPP